MGKLKEIREIFKKEKDPSAPAPIGDDDVVVEDDTEEAEEPADDAEIAKAEEEVKSAEVNLNKAKENIADVTDEEKVVTVQQILENHEARLQKIEYHLRI